MFIVEENMRKKVA